jgi:hypothetical protein
MSVKESHRAHNPSLDPEHAESEHKGPPQPSDPIRRDVTTTRPIDPAPDKQADPAFVPSDLQQTTGHRDKPWWKDEFRSKILEAGFPNSSVATDEAFLQALYKFQGGTISEEDLKREEETVPVEPEHKPQPHSGPATHAHQKKE